MLARPWTLSAKLYTVFLLCPVLPSLLAMENCFREEQSCIWLVVEELVRPGCTTNGTRTPQKKIPAITDIRRRIRKSTGRRSGYSTMLVFTWEGTRWGIVQSP